MVHFLTLRAGSFQIYVCMHILSVLQLIFLCLRDLCEEFHGFRTCKGSLTKFMFKPLIHTTLTGEFTIGFTVSFPIGHSGMYAFLSGGFNTHWSQHIPFVLGRRIIFELRYKLHPFSLFFHASIIVTASS